MILGQVPKFSQPELLCLFNGEDKTINIKALSFGLNENMCKKYSVRHKCKFIIEIYFFQKGDFIVYALMRAKNKKSVLQESKMSILESIEIK